jgi:hypothetical protein
MWGYLIVPALAVVMVVVVVRLRTAEARTRFLRRAGLVLMAVFTAIGALWIAAEAFADPGGWQAAVMTAAWLVPMVGLSIVAWYRDELAAVALEVLTTAAIAVNLWATVDPDSWRSFEDSRGPVRAIASFALAAPIAVLGRRRPLPAGVLLVALAVLPMAMSVVAGIPGLSSLSVVSFPLFVTGVLYLAAAAISHKGTAAEGPDGTRATKVRHHWSGSSR